MKTKAKKTDEVITPEPPQVMDPSKPPAGVLKGKKADLAKSGKSTVRKTKTKLKSPGNLKAKPV